ncbi:TetR/AcrR family transcriptional regulator [Curtobacterium sp. MCBA15_012]|uniref:TetR/AcrR family transcriptional regulator n=1 Tax=Curtobacterium sp. MCBA15_012 TaxID=1898738 RepID=UPI0008DC6FA7|nr:TetR/AcrR family transcriptional regulator [Curtobacterium sp. MCBA15_012]WIA99546.1 WHG domain-containing protein [Curtobacterium sp. MCBA15_012]
MTDRPFHHGNLRAVLLDEAVAALRESGVEGLSLRELARRAGVSHGAPRSHFVDRRALLDALAVLGFERLHDRVQQAIAGSDGLRDRFRRVAHAYVDFAVEDAALMELMFEGKAVGAAAAEVQAAAGTLFTLLDSAMGPARAGTPTDQDEGAPDGGGHDDGDHEGDPRDGDPRDDGARETFKMLFAATMQGIATLVVSRRIGRAQGDELVDAAAETMLGSDLARRAVSAD